DLATSVPVCIVNEDFVRVHMNGRSPIGMRVSLRTTLESTPVEREIVGVARQVKERPDGTEAFTQVYVPLAQDPLGDMFLVMRPASGRAGALAPSVRAAIGRVD